ncbi:MAG: DUF1778 domain-containing protein [Fimbriimonadaceae bacterium]|nr:DUF1778 domain-containing protein [Chthonomonadaceae bacterium]MCO5298058.1 DUF1778 domain-containing protein [Fimbriimonadaceae bacterium]
MPRKAEHLHIRASEREKATLAQAAQVKNMTVSQFVLQTSVPVAEEIVNQEAGNVRTLFRLNAEEWEEFNRLLDAPTRDIPELRELLRSRAPWEK